MFYSLEEEQYTPESSNAMMLPFFNVMVERGASDLFLTAHAPPQLKIDAVFCPINNRPLSQRMVQRLAYSLMDAMQMAVFEQDHEMNLRCDIVGAGNFRINIFRQRGSVAMVVRYIAHEIPNFEHLALPQSILPLILEKRGLIFVVGGTGSGKSTTMAALVQHRNAVQTGHILTLEDPIEFIFHHQKSLVNQREIGSDTHSMEAALKNAMRESPDVLMIGEIRDAATLMHAINYAQSGHLCIASMHANNSYHMLSRVLSFFPSDARSGLLMDLSVALKAVVSQRLVPGVKGRQIPAVEVLMNTPHIAELIRHGDIHQIKEAISNSMDDVSQTFEQALFQLYQTGCIELDQALKHADSPTNLYWLINHHSDHIEPAQPNDGPIPRIAPMADVLRDKKLDV